MATDVRPRTMQQQAAGASLQIVLLAALSAGAGLGPVGWLAGIAYVLGLWVLLAAAVRRARITTLGPADLVTLVRAVLVGGVTALVADGLTDGGAPVAPLVVVATAALILDAVDGQVARRSGTVSELGARFDMEVDAFLVLVLSIHVAVLVGPWALAIGALRYAFVAASWTAPWLRSALPVRYSAKAVAAVQGIVLVVAASGVLPRLPTIVLVATALVVLVWSFGRDVVWLWRRAVPVHEAGPAGQQEDRHRAGVRRVAACATTALACLVVLVGLVAPNEVGDLTAGAFVRIPVEGLLGVALLLVLPARARRVAAVLGGVVLGLLTILKILDAGFFAVLARPFDPVIDWVLFGAGLEVLAGSVGRAGAIGSVVAAAVVATAVLVLMTLAVLRLTRLVVRRSSAAISAVTVLGAMWVACVVLGAQIVPGVPVASRDAAVLVHDRAAQVRERLLDRQTFAAQAGVDAFRDVPSEDLLTALRGKDVVVSFVESYGRDAIEDPEFATQVGAVLEDGNRRLGAAGFASRSAFLTSPTAGGSSWLAHATFLSGLWIDNNQRHRALVASDRLTLTSAFRRADWRTVAVMPGTTGDWPEAAFYGYDGVYDFRALGYRGPDLGWASVPDQYTLSAFERSEHSTPDRPPLMAEIALVSSHAPWPLIPSLVDWGEVGDGSIFGRMASGGEARDAVWAKGPTHVRSEYRRSIEYSLSSLISYVQNYGDDDLVLVFLGDHQAAPIVTGDGAGHDVPITIVTRDRALLERISGWGWQDGLKPGPQAPVWPMDAFRDRFLTAFGR